MTSRVGQGEVGALGRRNLDLWSTHCVPGPRLGSELALPSRLTLLPFYRQGLSCEVLAQYYRAGVQMGKAEIRSE